MGKQLVRSRKLALECAIACIVAGSVAGQCTSLDDCLAVADLRGCSVPAADLVSYATGTCTYEVWDEDCRIYASTGRRACTNGPSADATVATNRWGECIYTWADCSVAGGGQDEPQPQPQPQDEPPQGLCSDVTECIAMVNMQGCEVAALEMVSLSDRDGGTCTYEVWDEACAIYENGGDCSQGPPQSTARKNSWDECVYAWTACGGTAGVVEAQPMCVWNHAYQENFQGDSVAQILSTARNCYVLVDPFESTAVSSAIPDMKRNGNTVSCYMSVGTCENWRADFNLVRPYCVDQQWGEWAGEYFVDETDTGILDPMKERLDKMADWGCDMVEFDNMDWTFDDDYRSEYGFSATEADGIAFIRNLCDHARSKNMGCMAKSTTQGAADFVGMTVESYPAETNWWDQDQMEAMLAAGKIGLVVHYDETDCSGVYAWYTGLYGNKLSFICEDRNTQRYVHFNANS